MKISELLNEAHPKQQLSRYNPDGETYRGHKMPSYSHDDIMMNPEHGGERVDRVQHGDMSRNDTEVDPFEREFEQGNLKRLIAQYLDQMPARDRMILKMRFWNDMSHDEIAQHLDLSRDRVRQIEARALRKLKHPDVSDRLRHHTPADVEREIPDTRGFYSRGWQDGYAFKPEHAGSSNRSNLSAYTGGYQAGKEQRMQELEHNKNISAGDDYGKLRGIHTIKKPLNKPVDNPRSTGDWQYGKNGRY